MTRLRACDACSLRKVRCAGDQPCSNCTNLGFNCSYAKRRGKPGPKGPRRETRVRVNKHLQDLTNATTPRPGLSPSQEEEEAAANTERPVLTSPASVPLPRPSTGGVPKSAIWESSFSLNDVLTYVQLYNERMYPVWPVVNGARLGAMIKQGSYNYEICALVFAVCASTGAQLRLDNSPRDQTGLPYAEEETSLTDRFASQAERCRSMYDYRESTTIEAVLIPLFLHFYYGTKSKNQTTSLLLRESVTLCQLLGLDREETYCTLNPEEESYWRRTFWLLYVTERGHAMQHETGICLANSINLPSTECQSESHLLQAFYSLICLFAYVDGVLVDPKDRVGVRDRKYNREMLSRLQHQIRQHPDCPAGCSEIQRSDISITRQWLCILVWQLSLRNVSMSGDPTDDSMSFTYPAYVARDTLHSISTVSFNALVAHGPGMASYFNLKL